MENLSPGFDFNIFLPINHVAVAVIGCLKANLAAPKAILGNVLPKNLCSPDALDPICLTFCKRALDLEYFTNLLPVI